MTRQEIKNIIEENGFFTTLDTEKDENLEYIANAMSGISTSLSECDSKIISVIGVYITKSNVGADNFRTVIISDDGSLYSGNGNTVFEAITGFVSLFSKNELRPNVENPLKIKVTMKSTIGNSSKKYPLLSITK
jgi:hypothetical protein